MGTKNYRILLVDDDLLSQRMMSFLLSAGGYSHEKAFNGVEALKAVQSQHFDLILMDLQMPIMDGYEAAQSIRAWEAGNGHIPIIALTAMAFDDDQLYRAAGMDDCIVKPFDTPKLYRMIDFYVEMSKNSEAAQPADKMKLEEKTPLLNIKAALPRFGNDIQVYQELLLEFLQSLPERLEQIRSMFVSGDFQSLSRDAHNLKGVAASIGAMQISALAAQLEQQSCSGESRLIEETLNECEKNALDFEKFAMKMLSTYPHVMDKID